jgi:hypothetical protein
MALTSAPAPAPLFSCLRRAFSEPANPRDPSQRRSAELKAAARASGCVVAVTQHTSADEGGEAVAPASTTHPPAPAPAAETPTLINDADPVRSALDMKAEDFSLDLDESEEDAAVAVVESIVNIKKAHRDDMCLVRSGCEKSINDWRAQSIARDKQAAAHTDDTP